MKKIRFGLNARIALIVLTLVLLLSAILMQNWYRSTYKIYMSFCHDRSRQITELVADWTDWEKIEHFAETGEPDEYSEQLAYFYKTVKSELGKESALGLCIPHDGYLTTIYEAIVPGDDPKNISSWGDQYVLRGELGERMTSDLRAGHGNETIAMNAAYVDDEMILLDTWEPVFDRDGTIRAVVFMQQSIRSIDSDLRAYMLRVGAMMCILFIAPAMALILLFLRQSIIKPIKRLEKMVDSYENGAFAEEKFRYDDEIQSLANSFTGMAHRIEAYTDEVKRTSVEKERINTEFGVARQIQHDTLPTVFPAFPERREFDIFAVLEASKNISGNFYDFFLIDDDHLALAIGDISGRGIPAALFMVMVRTLIKDRCLQGDSPAEALQSVSEQLLEGNQTNMFATVWLAVLELSTGAGVAVNAGHQHPILCRAGKKFELQVYPHCPPIAAMEGVRFRNHGFQLSPGDTLFVYTVGTVDVQNAKGEAFGTQRILEELNREPEATPSVLLQTVTTALHRFSGEAPCLDDRTLLSMKYYGKDGVPSQ